MFSMLLVMMVMMMAKNASGGGGGGAGSGELAQDRWTIVMASPQRHLSNVGYCHTVTGL